jgi:membrane-associated phospholipid phosphatase
MRVSNWSTAMRRTVSFPLKLTRNYRDGQVRHRRALLIVQIVYFAVLGGALLYTGNWPTPDQIGLALFAFAILMARPLAFLRDWAPFVLLILSYEALRGNADGLVANVHIGFPITMDKAMFGGTLPTVWLQDKLWDPNNITWYDYVAAFMHPMHFLVPLAVAFVFWMRSQRLYWRFVASYLLLTYSGFVTYVLYPMAPPWYAGDIGRIPHVDTILGEVLWRNSVSHPLVFVYDHFNPNPVAAMPSLHAAFPVLIFLICLKLNPRWGWLSIFYPLLMDFAVVYMGEHYVTDCIAGTVYGAAAFYICWVLPGQVKAWRTRRVGVEQVAPAGLPEAATAQTTALPPGGSE